MVKTIKNLLLWNRWIDFNETWYVALGTLFPVIVYINHDLGLTLTYFTASSILVTQAFQWKKMKTLNFSGSLVACDLKVGRYRQHVELMKYCEYKRSRSFLDLGQRSFTN